MIDPRSRLGEEFEAAVARAHRRAAVGRAVVAWEWWIVLASVLYIATRFAAWAAAGFPVVGR